MKTAKQVFAKIFKVDCPHCSEEVIVLWADPRGKKVKCDWCNKKFKVVKDAEVIIRGRQDE